MTVRNLADEARAWFTSGLALDLFLWAAFCFCLLFLAITDIRITIYHAITFDDYGGYLEYLLSSGASGEIPTTPWRERIGGVVAFLPFAYLPPIPFGGGQGVIGDRAYLYHAIIIGNMFYLSLMSASILYLKQEQKLFYVLLTVLFAALVGFKGVAVVGFCFVFAIVLMHKRSFLVTAILLLLGITVAEKVVLTVGAYFGAIILLHANERGIWRQVRNGVVNVADIPWRYVLLVGACGILILVYLYVRATYGNYFTTDTPLLLDPLGKIGAFTSLFFSPRGFILMAPAPFLLIGICYFSLPRDGFIRIMIVLAVLTVASVQGELGITIGRVLFYTMPLIVYEYMQMNGFRLRAQSATE